MKYTLLCTLGILLFFGCVPKNKFDALLLQNGKTQMQRDSLNELAGKLPGAQNNLATARQQLLATQEHLNDLKTRHDALTGNYADIERRYNDLLDQNKKVLENSSTQVQALSSALSSKESELDKREKELQRLAFSLKQKEATLSQVNDNYKTYEGKIQNLEATLAKNQAQLDALKANVISALTGFQASDLSVAERNGKIYVSLSQDLLFASGSDQIDTKGKDAISKLAGALKGNKDFLINVEGHTDAQGAVDKNWDLSVRRATSVVKILTTAGLDPKTITASGRALYDPLSENESAEGRAKNRRTEIILAPRLNELYQLVK